MARRLRRTRNVSRKAASVFSKAGQRAVGSLLIRRCYRAHGIFDHWCIPESLEWGIWSTRTLQLAADAKELKSGMAARLGRLD